MQVTHLFGKKRVSKGVKGPVQALLTDRNGSYFLWEDSPTTRYGGFFWYDVSSKKMFKIIEHINQKGTEKMTEIVNDFCMIRRRGGYSGEAAFMPSGRSSLVCTLSRTGEMEFFLDVKESFDSREWGRHYAITEEKGCVVVRFTKRTDGREDGSHGQEEYSLYLAIAGHDSFSRREEWTRREYAADRERNSPPSSRYVLGAGSLKGRAFVFSVSRDKENAMKEAKSLLGLYPRMMKEEEQSLRALARQKNVALVLSSSEVSEEAKMAFLSAFFSLDRLAVHHQASRGIFAGLPWFFQFWSRDSLVAAKALGIIHPRLEREIIVQYLHAVGDDGRLPNCLPVYPGSPNGSADSIGWLFLRAEEGAGRALLKSAVTKAAEGLLSHHTQDMLDINGPKETWMDTQHGDDGRQGKRIEIQALRLALYRTAHQMTGNGRYLVREQEMREQVRKAFWDGKKLADGENDVTIRPNVFIAAYAYPDLLSPKEWETCFDSMLPKLWLPWGGLSTIDVSHSLFRKEHTGQDVASYHRGDSWFWVNNLAALVLSRANKVRFKRYIEKITGASIKEILWQGAIGHHAELSSASSLRSQGCLAQAWSDAMFVELVIELSKGEQ